MANLKAFLRPKKEQSLYRFHPWIFSGAIARYEKEPEEGDIVDIFTADKTFIARGHYQIGSIAVRVLTFDETEEINDAFWTKRIGTALKVRESVGLANNPNNNTYRLIHGEGDFLPGLIVDIYDETAVIQAHSVGMHFARNIVAQTIIDVMNSKVKHVYYKSETTLPFKANLDATDGFIIGGDKNNIAIENGLKFHVDWLKGQKTGFFVDQRDNRALLEKYAKDKSVLNMFCYTGGFSFYAMRGGAKVVHSVDSSAKAIDLTNENIHRIKF